MKNWLRKRLRKWLGIDEIDVRSCRNEDEINVDRCVSIDHGYKVNTTITVSSTIGKGYIKHVHMNFKDMHELRGYMDARFPNWSKSGHIYQDSPYKMPRMEF